MLLIREQRGIDRAPLFVLAVTMMLNGLVPVARLAGSFPVMVPVPLSILSPSGRPAA